MSNQLFKKAEQNLHKIWGYPSFREGQKDAIQSVLGGDPTLVLFPTGGGKSLCYQVPATVFNGMTLVISPLIALMQDQVEQLNDKGIAATFINSSISRRVVEQRLVNARNGMYRLLYCSPERLDTQLWQSELPNLDIELVAIDEAHCISEWGHDFRPHYRSIYPALESIAESTRWIALTATATPEVRSDITQNLHFDEPTVVSTGFERPNLKWWVIDTPKKRDKLIQSIHKGAKEGSGIVYAGTRRNCEKLADMLANKLNIEAAAYHAGLNSDERSVIQQAWVSDELPLVVATSAFGMGIDKADCRYVIHYQMPYSPEAYYQQAGRAGRDGEQSFPILLFKAADMHEAVERIERAYPTKKQLQKTYDAVCDELNIVLGEKEERWRTVTFKALKKRSKLTFSSLRTALKTLKNFNVVELQEHQDAQMHIKFTVNVETLNKRIQQEQNEKKATFLDLLYRRLGPESFEDFVRIKMSAIQQKLNLTQNGLIKGLRTLQDHDHLLTFELLGEQPLVRLVDERVRALSISTKSLEEGKKRMLKKLQYMEGYIETDECRELYLRRYLGDEETQRCGHCDNCLQHQKDGTTTFTNEDITALKNLLNHEGMTITKVQNHLQWSQKKLKKVIRYLMREEKITVDQEEIYWDQ